MQSKLNTSAGRAGSATGKAIRAAILAAGCFSLMFALIKLLGKGYPSGEILFSRSFFALIPLMPVIMRHGGLAVLKTTKPWQHATRSAMGLLSAFLCIESLKLLPLSEATSLFYAAPLITTLIAVPLLGERVSKAKGAAILTGFLGVIYMLQPRLSTNVLGASMALASAVSSAFVYIELSRMSATEKALQLSFIFMLACSVAGLLTMPFGFVLPSGHDALLLLAIGVIGGVAQFLMTEAYALAPATTVAPLSYLALLWAVLLDMAFWGRMPDLGSLAGACVIAISGIFVIAPERSSKGQTKAVLKQSVAPTPQ